MSKHCFVVITSPLEGRDKEYNEWYNTQHLSDVLRLPGFISAQRLKISSENSAIPGKYLALYQMETDDPEQAVKNLFSKLGGPEMSVSEAVDMSSVSTLLCSVIAEA